MTIDAPRSALPGLDSIEDARGLLAGLFEHSPVAFQIYRADGHCLLVNRAFRELFGSEPPPEYSILKDDVVERSGFLELVHRAFAGETVRVPSHWYDPRELRQISVHEGRRIGIETTLFPLRDGEGKVQFIALCVRDATAELELKAAAEALRHSEEQLRQSQKMEAIGRLAGGIAHDFNNLLSVIVGYADLAGRGLPPADPLRGPLEQITHAGNRASDLTRQLLAFSRRQVLQPRVVDLNDAISGMARMLRRIIGEDIELVVSLVPTLGMVYMDPDQMEQVLLNLVVNARDAMPQGGKVTIETADAELDDAFATSHLGVVPGRYVVLCVSDTGVGMDRATQAKIFEPFFTTKEKGKGTGLGLSMVFGTVRQSGGTVWVYSEPDKGTTFKLYLPRTEATADPPEPPELPPVVTQGSETVLLVEDDEQVRALVSTILSTHGYRVLEAATGGDALVVCREVTEKIDVLLTDVVMPGMGGRQLWELLAPQRPGMKVLFMSGYTDDSIVHHGVLSSELAFVQKPLMPGALLQKLRGVLDEKG